MDRLHWREQGLGERVLRVWLGVTFLYAGVQKLSDPGFFHEGSATYIGTQIDGFAHGSPIAPLLHLAGHVPVLAGGGVAVTEILIGLATLVGFAPAIAAGVGSLLSVTLWLSASWHVYPYFLGSDSIYAVAWLAYLLMLPEVRARLAGRGTARGTGRQPREPQDDARRSMLLGGAVVLGGLALGGAAALVGRSRDDSRASASGGTGTTSGNDPSATPTSGGAAITSLANLQQQGAVTFDDPGAGAAVVVSLGGDRAAAFLRKCTHAGCPVDYDASTRLLLCPCHKSQFDPADGARVVRGPAPTPLAPVNVVVDTATGEVRQA